MTHDHECGNGLEDPAGMPAGDGGCMYRIGDIADTFINGDAATVMRRIPSGSIDLVVTSPPYNLLNSSGGGMKGHGRGSKWHNAKLRGGYGSGLYSDDLPYDQYVAWQRECLAEMMRIIPDDGAIFYNHKWRVQHGLIQDRHEIVEGFPVRQVIIWKRKGGINFNPGYFLPTYEVIYLIAKKNFRLARGANKLGDVWEFAQDTANPHPASFPLPLAERIVSSTTAETVLDPFMGSGTTALAALHQHRRFVGIELSADYCAMARDRIAHDGFDG